MSTWVWALIALLAMSGLVGLFWLWVSRIALDNEDGDYPW